MAQVTVNLPEDIVERLDKMAAEANRTRDHILARALALFLGDPAVIKKEASWGVKP